VSCRVQGFVGIAEIHAGNKINIRCAYVLAWPQQAETAQAICKSIRKG
jgi:hypothetical protein